MAKKSTRRRLQILLLAAAVIMVILYIVNRWVLYSRFDRSTPEITFDSEVLEVSVAVTEEELLNGVTAADKKDGDVTDTIIIESISKMLGDHERIVTYAAFDKDNHVGKAQRKIRYTDYTSPRFSLDGPLEAGTMNAEMSDILAPLHATDCIDGDLTSQIVVIDTEITSMSADAMTAQYEVQVTNSCGDVTTLKLPVRMQMNTSGSFAEIKLSEYLAYRKVGEAVDPAAFVVSASAGGQEYGVGGLQINSNLDTSMPGVYTVTYTLSVEGNSTSTDLIIVVEE
ncbi:hypothetical protein [Dorea sp. YH-dor228]|uniref:hypothetical protein n=1 Tax=Dorea sp. YH-dor228 TaxID=3151120 RepID=UPI002A7C6B13|nr:hypothetical protein [Lachnospiraceae bacterium]